MSYNRELWTEEEVEKLKFLYLSTTTFEDIKKSFPKRSSNAIRQKASKLGLRRPTISISLSECQNVLLFSNGKEEDYLFKCSGCGMWINSNLNGEIKNKTIICNRCQTLIRYVT
jgi:hypothetical protein